MKLGGKKWHELGTKGAAPKGNTRGRSLSTRKLAQKRLRNAVSTANSAESDANKVKSPGLSKWGVLRTAQYAAKRKQQPIKLAAAKPSNWAVLRSIGILSNASGKVSSQQC